MRISRDRSVRSWLSYMLVTFIKTKSLARMNDSLMDVVVCSQPGTLVVEQRPVPVITEQRLDEVAKQFTGAMRQMPPMHSALKKDGKALYEYARAGEEVV